MSRRIVRELIAQVDDLTVERDFLRRERDQLMLEREWREVSWTQPNAS